MRVALSSLIGLAIGGLIGSLLTWHWRGAPEASSELAPDPALVRYRHSLTTPDTDDLASTIAALETRVKDAPNPFDTAELAELYYRRAQRQGDPHDYANSETTAKRSLELLKTPNTAHLTLAKLANARHDFRHAIELAQEQLASSKTPGPYILIATAYLALGEPPAAIEAANTAVALRSDAGSYLTRALVLQAQGRDMEAASDFARAASLEQHGDKQGAARLRTLWGRFLLRRGEYGGAAMLLDEALRIAPKYPLAVACRGELALRSGDPTEAAKLFKEAFVSSKESRYLIDQARGQELSGDLAAADGLRALAEKLARAELEGDGLGHRLELVEILVDRGGSDRLAEALAIAQEEMTRRSSFEVRFQLARALARMGRREEALAEVQGALALGTREAQLYELAARLEQNPGRAAMYMREADKLDPARTGWRTLGIESLR